MRKQSIRTENITMYSHSENITMYSHFACAIVNDDPSGLSDIDEQELNTALAQIKEDYPTLQYITVEPEQEECFLHAPEYPRCCLAGTCIMYTLVI